jgi:hypothetical protein
VSDDQDRSGLPPAWWEGMRRLRELGEQVAAAARAAAAAGAKATPPALARPLAGYTEQLLSVSSAITDPLQQLLDEQERLVERMGDWARQHRQLSDQIAQWADQQRELSERVIALARPFLDQSAMLETLNAEWSRRTAEPEGDAPG